MYAGRGWWRHRGQVGVNSTRQGPRCVWRDHNQYCGVVTVEAELDVAMALDRQICPAKLEARQCSKMPLTSAAPRQPSSRVLPHGRRNLLSGFGPHTSARTNTPCQGDEEQCCCQTPVPVQKLVEFHYLAELWLASSLDDFQIGGGYTAEEAPS